MENYSGVVFTKVIGKKFIFFKEKANYMKAIYYDEKFYKKKKWPGHLGSLFYRFEGKNKDNPPKYLRFDTNMEVDKEYPRVTYLPDQETAQKFVDDIGGDFEVLDSARYANKAYTACFDVFNIYDNENKCYMIYIYGWTSKGGAGGHKKLIDLVSRGLRKSFNEL